MAALDLFGRRWVLRILGELHRGGPLGFRPLKQRCDAMSSTVLHQRPAELRAARLVEQAPGTEYGLTALGRDSCATLDGLTQRSLRWASEPGAESPDADSPLPRRGSGRTGAPDQRP